MSHHLKVASLRYCLMMHRIKQTLNPTTEQQINVNAEMNGYFTASGDKEDDKLSLISDNVFPEHIQSIHVNLRDAQGRI